jgi:Fanconi anemia group M protein
LADNLTLEDFSEEKKKLISKMVQGPFLIMDSKERAKNPRIYESFVAQGITVEVHALKSGDYWLPSPEDKDILIERKTAFDMIHTLREGRLWDQLKALAELKEVTPILLLEGSPTIIKKFSNWSEASIAGILWSITLGWKVRLMFTPSPIWTGISIGQQCKTMSAEKKFRIYPLRVKVNRTMTEDEAARFIVEGLPNVSAVLADRLLQQFKTPRKVFTATNEELKQIEGLGPKKIERICQTLDHTYVPKPKKKEAETTEAVEEESEACPP